VTDYRDVFGSGVPGPFLTLTLEWEGRTRDIVALVDTGADMTQIPNITAQVLALEQVDVMPTTSSHGDTDDKPVYVANIQLTGIAFPAMWVVGDNYPVALIGRDVLNDLFASFDGPGRSFELQRPSSASA
jgi:predicted aspartyl protease